MRWQFWKQDPDKNDQQGDSNNPNQNTPPSDKDGKVTHAELNDRIEQIIKKTQEDITPLVNDIQKSYGDITSITHWVGKTQNLVDIVLKYEAEGNAPSRKDFLYGNVFSHGGTPDLTRGVEYQERLDDYLSEHRPADSIFKNWRKRTIEEKQDFLSKFELFAEALRADVDAEHEKTTEQLQETKENAYNRVKNIYGFYERLIEAVEARDLDAMLDISHGRTHSVVKRVLNVNLREMEERDEVEALVRHIGVQDKIFDMAAQAATPEDGLEILAKVLDGMTKPSYILWFMENVIARMPSTNGHPLYEAYVDVMDQYIGDYLHINDNHIVNIDTIFGIHPSTENPLALCLHNQGGINSATETLLELDNPEMVSAYMRVLARRDHLVPLPGNTENTLLNIHNIAYFDAGYYDSSEYEDLGVPFVKEDNESGHDQLKEEAAPLNADIQTYGVKLYCRTDHQSWTEIPVEVTSPAEIADFAADITEKGALRRFDGLPFMDLRDIVMAKYDTDSQTLFWAVSNAVNDPEWFQYHTPDDEGAAFINAIAERNNWAEMTNEWVFNLDKIQRITYAPAEDDIDLDELMTADQCREQFFNNGKEFVIDQVNLEEMMQSVSLDIEEALDLDDAAALSLEDALLDTPDDSEEPQQPTEAPSVLTIATQGGMNGFTNWYDSDITQEDARSLIDALSKYRPLVKVANDFMVNADQLYTAHAKMTEFPTFDEFGMPLDETYIEPALSINAYDNKGDYEEMKFIISEERMKTIIQDFSAASDAFTHIIDRDNEFLAFAAFGTHLQGMALSEIEPAISQTDENAAPEENEPDNDTEQTLDTVTPSKSEAINAHYFYRTTDNDYSKWTIEAAESGLANELAFMSSVNMATIIGTDRLNHAAIRRDAILAAKYDGDGKKGTLKLAVATGINGNNESRFSHVSSEEFTSLRERFNACGNNKTILTDIAAEHKKKAAAALAAETETSAPHTEQTLTEDHATDTRIMQDTPQPRAPKP